MNTARTPAAADPPCPRRLPPRRGSLTVALEEMKYRSRADEPGLYKERRERGSESR